MFASLRTFIVLHTVLFDIFIVIFHFSLYNRFKKRYDVRVINFTPMGSIQGGNTHEEADCSGARRNAVHGRLSRAGR